ncbi:MAG: sugar transferase [Rhodocyclaceae bacterium]|nr:sugar transferase [Rhodocyclaceae bacterium]
MFLKRLFDFFVALAALLVLWPVILVLGIAVKLDSPGPMLFRQKRVGRHGKIFRIHKLRTMRSDQSGTSMTARGDARITRVGKLLRHSKLDELPQFIDVLTGDMSLVGPRPQPVPHVDHYPPEIREKVLSVRPGLTDLATLEFIDEERILSQADDVHTAYIQDILPIKLKYCVQYVETRTFWLDIQILWRTATALLSRLFSTHR